MMSERIKLIDKERKSLELRDNELIKEADAIRTDKNRLEWFAKDIPYVLANDFRKTFGYSDLLTTNGEFVERLTKIASKEVIENDAKKLAKREVEIANKNVERAERELHDREFSLNRTIKYRDNDIEANNREIKRLKDVKDDQNIKLREKDREIIELTGKVAALEEAATEGSKLWESLTKLSGIHAEKMVNRFS